MPWLGEGDPVNSSTRAKLIEFEPAWLDDLVAMWLQRCGIGNQMLTWAKGQSSGSLWLCTFARNEGARSFYERSGFIATGHGFEAQWRLEDVKYCWSEKRTPAR